MENFKSGHSIPRGGFKTFEPSPINREWTLKNMEIIELLGQADREIGKLDMFSEYVPNIDLFISMHVAKEATQSSRIEGTQTRIDETFLDQKLVKQENRDDWEEVNNYINALRYAITRQKEIPISTRLIQEIHEILLKGVRGMHKLPGAYRKSQNWIGGASLKDAKFIPPNHNSIPDLMSDLEKFAHNEQVKLPVLLQTALIHYQFETIHPFLDGNGRVGRLLITLCLLDKGILKRPILYLSDFFERNKHMYYDNLSKARTENDLESWFKFFLVGVIETALDGIATFDKILKLKEGLEIKMSNWGTKAGPGRLLLNALFQKPVTDANQVRKITGLSKPSVYSLLRKFEQEKILVEITGGKRGQVFSFKEYLNLFS